MTRVRGDPFCLWVSLLFPHDQLACTGTALFAMGPAAQAICECGPKVSHFTTSLHPASASSPLYCGKPHGFSKKPSTGLPMDPTGTACFLPHHNSITSFFPTKDPAVSLFPPQSFLPVLPVPFSVVCPSTTVTLFYSTALVVPYEMLAHVNKAHTLTVPGCHSWLLPRHQNIQCCMYWLLSFQCT